MRKILQNMRANPKIAQLEKLALTASPFFCISAGSQRCVDTSWVGRAVTTDDYDDNDNGNDIDNDDDYINEDYEHYKHENDEGNDDGK